MLEQTGMATGPHLHYEFRIDGTHRDPLSVTLPKARAAAASRAGALPRPDPADAGQAQDARSHASRAGEVRVAGAPELYLGLISGTSADGIDVALASFAPSPQLHASATCAYPEHLRQRILALAQGDGRIELDELGALDVEIARAFATAALRVLADHGVAAAEVRALGSHGQTVRHRPGTATPYTLQLGDPNIIAEATGIVTVADFRRRDMAAGGQGAPLAPAFHAAMLGSDGASHVVLNLGGIRQYHGVAGNSAEPILGFDTGPASCLLDAWAQRPSRGVGFDADGKFAHPDEPIPALAGADAG
jgi:anhydro-N-acetylmuramic acid kinase